MKNVEKKVDYEQVCIWPGVLMDDPKEFEDFILEHFGTRIQFLETIVTKPDVNDSMGITGGRHDVFFSVHKDDIGKFAVPRLSVGIRWIEDVVSNTNGYPKNPIYPSRVLEYQTWNGDVETTEE